MSALTLDRIMKFVEMRGDDECWPYVGGDAIGRNTYGHIRTTTGSGQTTAITAPRAILTIVLGRPLGPKMYVCHTCHWKPCCNPRHLVEGTPKQNHAMNPVNYSVIGGHACKGVKKRPEHG